MPAIDVAMRRSVQGGIVDGFVNLLVRSVQPALQPRDVVQEFNDVKTAFSSWDNCMQAAYCKYVHPNLSSPTRQCCRRDNTG